MAGGVVQRAFLRPAEGAERRGDVVLDLDQLPALALDLEAAPTPYRQWDPASRPRGRTAPPSSLRFNQPDFPDTLSRSPPPPSARA